MQCKDDDLLSGILYTSKEVPKLQTIDEMLAMCYFQYLESSQFLHADKNYLYGELLQ